MEYTKDNPLRVVELFAGYGSQCMALDRLKEFFPDFDYELVAWSEIDKYAIAAHDAVYPQWAGRNLGDITQVDWDTAPDCDLATWSFPCVVGSTKVLMHDGTSSMPIKDIKPGAWVLTSYGVRKVTALLERGPKPVRKYILDTTRGEVELTATPDHKVKVCGNAVSDHEMRISQTGRWVSICDLQAKDIVCVRGRYAVVKSVEAGDEYTQDVYDITVEDTHEFYANGLLVHNCTDISNAGKQAGLSQDSGTRSSLCWEALKGFEAKRPKYLLMENVKALTQKKFAYDFRMVRERLEEMGYVNYWEVLNAKNYGIPQNRERVFMVSILREEGEQWPVYEFPEPFPLEKRLKDVLEPAGSVPESYYLRQEQVDRIIAHCDRKQLEGCGFKTNFQTPEGG